MRKLTLFLIFLSLATLFSCDSDTALPQDPFSPTDDRDTSDDLNPDPDPTPDPTPTPQPTPSPDPNKATVELLPHVLSYKNITLTYKKRKAEPHQLFTYTVKDECHPDFPQKCMVDGQVLFQFLTEDINDQYPKELWRVTTIELISDYYTLKLDDPNEIICLSNYKYCSGHSLKNYRNRPFWRRGEVSDFLKSPSFANALFTGDKRDHLYIKRDLILNFQKVFLLDDRLIQTLIRKYPSVQINIGKDIFVDSPILKVSLEKRLP